ncbi:carbohydrate ABC transporter permease [Paenibacillus eucommiae]|uniref:Multiple sugar transport system permease protein n=1 Tax=Paenibacillus eucommiae TaxID=1355755 RepID=A0ABS4IT34_9BACL|nr:sugar ABC transporter permease [Paenibacillus eucommiae]MBP1990737.1 multiple sugar transport system permease protein [Paenibacillus eucommiae]
MTGKWARSKHLTGYLFISPWLIGLLVFTLFPLVYSFVLSFTDWNILEKANFVGFSNYDKMAHDENFWAAIRVTFIYSAVSVPLGIIFGVLLAILLNQKLPGIRLFRTIFYLPAVVSGVAVSMLWLWVFDPNYGIINTFLSWFGITGPQWLSDTKTALGSLILMSLWSIGGAMVIYLAGLQGISRELYEAADVDGATTVRKFWNITIPMLTPTIFFNLIMGIINSFQVFTQALVMTKGGPGNSTLFYVLYLYQNAFQFFKMGYASALGWVLFIIIMILVLVLFHTSGRWVYYGGDTPDAGKKPKRSKQAAGRRGKGGETV